VSDNNGTKSGFSRMMDTSIRLFLICAASAICLGIVNAVTQPLKVSNRAANEKSEIERIAANKTIGEETPVSNPVIKSMLPIYEKAGENRPSMYVLKIESSEGYSDIIKLLALYSVTGEVIDVRMGENRETPGLGKKAEDPAYMSKFRGRGGAPDKAIPLTKQMLAEQQKSAGGKSAQSGSSSEKDSFGLWLFGNSSSAGVDSVTGATITFQAIAHALYEGSEFVKKLQASPEAEPAKEETSGGTE
jgi:Na+-translocating ferredoxin:NAD+ oxidoreductase subunit G